MWVRLDVDHRGAKQKCTRRCRTDHNKTKINEIQCFLWFDHESCLSLCALVSILPIFTEIAVASGTIPSFHKIFKLIKRACFVKICRKTIPNFRPLVSNTL